MKREWIWDNEHLAALRKAIVDAKSRLFIYSGWLNIAVVEPISEELTKAVDRRVTVCIGYGWEHHSGRQSRSPEDEQREERALARLRAIAARSRQPDSMQVRRFPNHSKLLVCDDEYVICGSANWLSNSGYHNREVSVRLQDPQLVNELLAEAAADFA